MRFLYLRDPLFLFCVTTYFVNRFILKSIWKTGFVHESLNDLTCIPFWRRSRSGRSGDSVGATTTIHPKRARLSFP